MTEIFHSSTESRTNSRTNALQEELEEEEQEEHEEHPIVHIIPSDLDDQSTISSTDITLTEYLKDNYTPNTGTSVSEYLINNYPPKNSFYDQEQKNPVSMVPLRKASYGSNNSDLNSDENQQFEENQAPTGDDEELKKARRRMKNKISAQESRRRKKEYVDALELKMKQRDQEKKLLTEKVTELEEKVRLLVDELFQAKQNQNDSVSSSTKGFQSKTTVSIATQTGICLNCFTHTPSERATQRALHQSSSSASSAKDRCVSNSETNTEDLDANCHNYELDGLQKRHRYFDHENTPFRHKDSEEKLPYFNNKYTYDHFRTQTYKGSAYSPHALYEERTDGRVYYEKPYIRRTASVSPRLMKANATSPTATYRSPLRSNSSPLKSSAFPPRVTSSESCIQTSDSYSFVNSRLEVSLYSQLMDTERQVSPK